MDKIKTSERNPWAAAGMSVCLAGLGQIYCGALLRGLIFVAAVSLLTIVEIVALSTGAGAESGSLSAFGNVFGFGLGLLITAAAVIDAYRLARRSRPDYRLKEYNHWCFYILLLFISTAGQIGYAMHLRELSMQPFKIPNQSMYPAIQSGDQLIATKGTYAHKDPNRGDVVLFANPDNRTQTYVKRVVALAGESVEVRNGELYINEIKTPLERVGPQTVATPRAPLQGDVYQEIHQDVRYKVFLVDGKGRTRADFPRAIVPAHHVFVLGDNRQHSKDSRHFGPVPIAGLLGKASFLHWTGGDWSRLGAVK